MKKKAEPWTLRRKGDAAGAGRWSGPGKVLLAALLLCGVGGVAALAVNGEIKGSVVGTTDNNVPTYTLLIDTEFTSDGVRTIPSGRVRDLDQPVFENQDKGVGLIVAALGVVVTNSPLDAYAAETATQIQTTAFSQLNCGLNASGQRFCLGSMSTAGETRLKGKRLVVESPGGYSHILAVEGCTMCAAIVGGDSAFTADVDNAAIVVANAALNAAYPRLEPIELTWAFDIEAIGSPGAVEVIAADGYDVTEVFPNGPLVTDVTALASPSSASYIHTPELLYWNGMWIYCEGGVLSRDTCRLA